ncbi:MAG: SET domain-containing protein-lysine N-methyltransferase [Rhizonema sp. PD37]|nr:SET domain-containing protein-lysine N-methyltransferase [Rhizonema sp. PD37]
METQKTTSFSDPNHLKPESNQAVLEVIGQRNLDRTAIAVREIKQDEVIGDILPYLSKAKPDFLSVQIGIEEHILDSLLEAMNHSCSPTTFVDVKRMQVIAVRDILPGEELTFFYPSTEWEMDRSFQCNCKSPLCIGLVAGARSLSSSQIVQFKLNPHIKNLRKCASKID